MKIATERTSPNPINFVYRPNVARHLQEMAEKHPALAVDWVQLFRQIAPTYLSRIDMNDLFRRMLRPALSLDLLERDPEKLWELIDLAIETNANEALQEHCTEIFKRLSNAEHLAFALRRSPKAFLTIHHIARCSRSDENMSLARRGIGKFLRSRRNFDTVVSSLPLALLPRVRSLLEDLGDKELSNRLTL